MKLSVLANLYGAKSLDETLSILSGLGVHTVEIGAGGYPGKAHCNPAELLADKSKFDDFVATFKKYDMQICALAAHGNALHPDKAIAAQFDADFRDAVLLAEKLGVETIISPSRLSMNIMVRYARALENSKGSNVETLYKIMDGNAEALEFNVLGNSRAIGIPFRSIQLKPNILIAGITRGRKTIIPSGNDMILAGDKVVIVSALQGLHDIDDILA
jgi:Trk K+ transport system NAD-binding subunit